MSLIRSAPNWEMAGYSLIQVDEHGERNVFFDPVEEEDIPPPSPCRVIEITDEVRRLDEERRAKHEAALRITWKPPFDIERPEKRVFNIPKRKAVIHWIEQRPKKKTQKRTDRKGGDCKNCGMPFDYRNRSGYCRKCVKTYIADLKLEDRNRRCPGCGHYANVCQCATLAKECQVCHVRLGYRNRTGRCTRHCIGGSSNAKSPNRRDRRLGFPK